MHDQAPATSIDTGRDETVGRLVGIIYVIII